MSHKYNIGDILVQSDGEITLHYLIEDCKVHYMRYVYFFRVLETNDTHQQLVDVMDKARQITKVA